MPLVSGHEDRLAHVLGHEFVTGAGRKRSDEVLEQHDADDLVVVVVEDRQPREARALHHRRRMGDGGGVLGEHHVDAGHHDLAGDGVAELEDLVDHALLFVEQGALLGDEELDLLFADTRPPAVGLEAHETRHGRGRDGEEPHERREHALEPGDRAGHRNRDSLGALQPQPLRDQLAEDQRRVADEERHREHGEARRETGEQRQAETDEPRLERRSQRDRTCGRREEPDEGDADLDRREQPRGVVGEGERRLRALRALLGTSLERRTPARRSARSPPRRSSH